MSIGFGLKEVVVVLMVTIIGTVVVAGVEVQKFGHLFNPPHEEHHPHQQHHEDHQDLNKIPGVAGVDYPVYHEVPHTQFSCHQVPAVPGMYANVETGCQAYHVCHDGREGHQGASFLCTNGTIFNQKEFACDWWYNVKCEEATSYYHLNADPEHNPYTPKKKPTPEADAHDAHAVHDGHNVYAAHDGHADYAGYGGHSAYPAHNADFLIHA